MNKKPQPLVAAARNNPQLIILILLVVAFSLLVPSFLTQKNIINILKQSTNVAIAACGLAAGMDLPSSVAPFILRGVCLLGIDSVMCPIELRKTAWSRLARDLDPGKLAEITHEIGLAQVIDAGATILAGQVRGRIVVKIV